MSQTQLAVQGLKHSYAGREALAALDFCIHRGEVVGFLGVNGAGKSTTLRLIAGLLPIQQGRIRVGPHDRTQHPLAANRALGFLPDTPPLHDEQRVEAFLGYAGRLRGLSGPALRRALGRELERCQLGEVRRRLIGELSKGFRQRVGLAAALLHEPGLVLLDEPSSGLDPVQQAEFRTLVRSLGPEVAVLLSSHQLDEIEACCDRALILHEGRLHADLPLAQAHQPSLVLGLRERPTSERLLALPGVFAVEIMDEERLRLRLERRDPQILSAIAREAVVQGWGLTELTPGASELASRFFAISQGGSA